MAYGDEKTHGSAKYHGMKVGGIHRWTYPDGQWTERKVAPDRWEVTFSSLKRRDKKAPRDSGAEVGSGYHWLIVAHQWVDKLDANTYSTQMEGSKYLVAFKKPDWPVWNTQFRNQKRHAKEKAIAALEDAIRRLKESPEEFEDVVDLAAMVELAESFRAQEVEAVTESATMATAQGPKGTTEGTKEKEEDQPSDQLKEPRTRRSARRREGRGRPKRTTPGPIPAAPRQRPRRARRRERERQPEAR